MRKRLKYRDGATVKELTAATWEGLFHKALNKGLLKTDNQAGIDRFVNCSRHTEHDFMNGIYIFLNTNDFKLFY